MALDGFDDWKTASPAEYEAREVCNAKACPTCHGCEAACTDCPACTCDRCDVCGDRVAEHTRDGLFECGLWCSDCKGVCVCRASLGATCGHCAEAA